MKKIFNFIKDISDRELNYGREIIKNFSKLINYSPKKVLDIGCGMGFDLLNIKKIFPKVELYGLDSDFGDKIDYLKKNNKEINILNLDIEDNFVDMDEETFDIIISNQTMEHCKNIHHIVDQCNLLLKVNGILIIGVPNLASLHNRISLLIGKQPPSIKIDSGHVRGFTSKELSDFVIKITDGTLELIAYEGSNFYPFTPKISKLLSKIFPNLSVSIFFAFRKTKKYEQLYINKLKLNPYETKYKI